jgi:hypothetical protein
LSWWGHAKERGVLAEVSTFFTKARKSITTLLSCRPADPKWPQNSNAAKPFGRCGIIILNLFLGYVIRRN